MTSTRKSDLAREAEFDRGMMRAMIRSLFLGIINVLRKTDGYNLAELAAGLGLHKSAVSRWFTGDPNWTLNTVADIARELDLEISIIARHRPSGHLFAPYGRIHGGPETAPIREASRADDAESSTAPEETGRPILMADAA